MPISLLLDVQEKFEVQAYKKPKNRDQHTHIPFSGSPRKHPFEDEKLILIADPFTANTFYYEFNARDISSGSSSGCFINTLTVFER